MRGLLIANFLERSISKIYRSLLFSFLAITGVKVKKTYLGCAVIEGHILCKVRSVLLFSSENMLGYVNMDDPATTGVFSDVACP